MSADRPMGVLQNASDLVELLAERGPMTPGDIAEHIGMPRPSVYRLVDALNQTRLTVTMPDSRIKITERWLRLGDTARAGMREWHAARATLDALCHETGQTTFLSVPHDDHAVCIDWAPGRGINVLVLRPGRSLPLYAGAAGRATLAFMDDPAPYLARAPFPALTRRTLTKASQLRRDIKLTRDRGYSVSDEDVTDGIGALGVPLTTVSAGCAAPSPSGVWPRTSATTRRRSWCSSRRLGSDWPSPSRRTPPLTSPTSPPSTPVFFLSSSTGISAETMGNALLIQFPQLRFDRRLIPFISTEEEARRVVEVLDRAATAAADTGATPIAFTTVVSEEIRQILRTTTCPMIDFYGSHLPTVESVLGAPPAGIVGRLHGLGDMQRYTTRMAAIEYSIEHDDGQSLRAMDKAEVVLIAPSRCGKTPTTMYLALQHGLFVANYPLVEEDLETTDLPRPIAHLRDRVIGLVATPGRLSEVRQQRRPNSRYASLEQCTYELRRAEAMYAANRLPVINSTTKSVEEMSTLILQTLPGPRR